MQGVREGPQPSADNATMHVETLARHLIDTHLAELEGLLLQPEVESRPRPFPLCIDFMELHAARPAVANWMLQGPTAGLLCLNRAIQVAQERVLEGHSRCDEMCVKRLANPRLDLHRLTYPELRPSISRLRCAHVGKLVHVRGTVVRTGLPKVLEAGKEFVCTRCKHRFMVHANLAQGGKMQVPHECPSGLFAASRDEACPGSSFRPLEDTVFLRDFQEIKVQEGVHDANVGAVPRSLTVILEDDLVDVCRAGDDVHITGVLEVRWLGGLRLEQRCQVEHFFRANAIAVASKQQMVALEMPVHEAMAEFQSFWDSAAHCPLRARNHILNSVCPQIYGLSLVKLAVTLCLIGGTARLQPDGTRTRGEVHCLLVGDPGVGKSQFLRYAARLSPRAVMTTGKGSSNAGLTVTAVKDNGEWVLEAGALVLADGGICCIDEFNSIQDADRVVIHEAMEQQTLSVAKAGLVTTVETRTAVLAVMNVKSQYDPTMPLAVNTGLAAPLLSRFDVVLMVMDEKRPEWDEVVTHHILESHAPGCAGPNPSPRRQGPPLWDIGKLRRYIALVKEQFDPSLSPEAERLLGAYYSLQRRVEGRERHAARTTIRLLESLVRLAQAHARLSFRSTATTLDACMAIMLMDATAASPVLSRDDSTSVQACHGENPDEDYAEHERRIVGILTMELEAMESERREETRVRSSGGGTGRGGGYCDEDYEEDEWGRPHDIEPPPGVPRPGGRGW